MNNIEIMQAQRGGHINQIVEIKLKALPGFENDPDTPYTGKVAEDPITVGIFEGLGLIKYNSILVYDGTHLRLRGSDYNEFGHDVHPLTLRLTNKTKKILESYENDLWLLLHPVALDLGAYNYPQPTVTIEDLID